MATKTYSEKLKDPRWQKRRLDILSRDEFSCCACGDATKTLHVHHKWYDRSKEPWEYPDECLVTLCEDCHIEEEEYKCNQELLIKTLLSVGFFNFDLYPFYGHLGKAIKAVGRYEFEYLIKKLSSSDDFRQEVLTALQKTKIVWKTDNAEDPF